MIITVVLMIVQYYTVCDFVRFYAIILAAT